MYTAKVYTVSIVSPGVTIEEAKEAFNMRHWMNKNALSSFVSWLLTLVRRLFENENQYAWKDSTLATVAT